MTPGDVVLIPLVQVAGGPTKLRPALLLANLPGPYQTLLVCGITSKLHQQEPDWDDPIGPDDADFARSGLIEPRSSDSAISIQPIPANWPA